MADEVSYAVGWFQKADRNKEDRKKEESDRANPRERIMTLSGIEFTRRYFCAMCSPPNCGPCVTTATITPPQKPSGSACNKAAGWAKPAMTKA